MITATKGDETLIFNSVKECAKQLGLKYKTLSMAINEGLTYNGWRFVSSYKHTQHPNTGEGEIFDSTAVIIGIAPTGECIRFQNVTAAAIEFGVARPSIYFAIRRGAYSGRWKWIYDDGRDCVPITDKIKATFVPKKKTESTYDNRHRVTEKAHNIVVEGKEYSYGYYDDEIGPVICPVCGRVTGINGYKHLRNCLQGVQYKRMLNGVIVVKKEQ